MIDTSHNVYGIVQFILRNSRGTAENYRRRKFNLIAIKLRKILHIHLAFARIDHRGKSIQLHSGDFRFLNGFDNVAELSDSRRFNQNSVGAELFRNLLQGFSEISDKTATDTAGIHLRNLNSRLTKKSSINSYFTELVFDKNKFLTCVSLFYQFFNKRGFSGSEKTGEYINFCQFSFPPKRHFIISNYLLYHINWISSSVINEIISINCSVTMTLE